MGRYYRLTKKITDDMATEILRELREYEQVHTAEFTDGYKYLLVRAAEEDYSFVMTRALNICRKIGKGCEISFTRFAVEDLEASM